MSYDLHFYKSRNSTITVSQITHYLFQKSGKTEQGLRWRFENENTQVYFSIELDERYDHEDDRKTAESEDDQYVNFLDTGFWFQLNIVRPEFFGLEAFQVVEDLARDLDLYILNPQTEMDQPYKATKEELFYDWNHANTQFCSLQFQQFQLSYMSAETSNAAWKHNLQKQKLQEELGKQYFVPRILFFKHKQSQQLVTLAVWPINLPLLFPKVDYFLLVRSRRKWFRKIEENILVDSATIFQRFGSYLEDFRGNKILPPEKTGKTKGLFMSIAETFPFEQTLEGIAIERISNVIAKTES